MRILLVVHGFPPSACGGTELYVHDLACALARIAGNDVFVLTRSGDPHVRELAVQQTIRNNVTVFTINNTFQACHSFEDSYANHAIERIAAGLLEHITPDVVHVQHLTCLSTGIPGACRARGIPVVTTMNDYWMLCHRGQLLDRDGVRCAGPFEGGCAGCIPAGMLAPPAAYRAGRLARWLPVPGAAAAVRLGVRALEALTPAADTRKASLARLEHMRDTAAHVGLFLAPSATMAEQCARFGIPADRLARCNQGIDLAPFAHLQRRRANNLRVGFGGSLIPSKAPHVLLEAMAQLSPGSATVDLLGAPAPYHGDDRYAATLQPLLKAPWLRKLGPVPHDRMAAALGDIDVLVVPSVWIENAPFIIREAFAAGVPVVASRLGGMVEMVRDGVDGLLFPPGDAVSLAAHLQRLSSDPALLQDLRAGIRRPMSIEEDAAVLQEAYARLAPVEARRTPRSGRVPRAAHRLHAVVLNFRTPDQALIAVEALQAASRPPDAVVVVDNGSGDGSARRLRRTRRAVDVVEAPENLGFPAGCNVGIGAALEAAADFVLLVNTDVVLAPRAIEALMRAMESEEALGIAAPVLLSREEPDHVASAGISYSKTTARMRHAGAGLPLSRLAPQGLVRVDAVSGCVMLIRRAVFERVGLLDPDYFFSFEDIDFCLRARAAGFEVACVHDALAYHEGGRSIGRRSARRVYFATRNHLRLASRANLRGRMLRAPFVVALNAAYAVLAPDAPLVSGLAAVARGTWDHLRGRYGAGVGTQSHTRTGGRETLS